MSIQWATSDELSAMIQRSPINTTSADLYLTQAAQAIRGWCQQTIDITQTDDMFDGPQQTSVWNTTTDLSKLFLPEKRLISVDSVTEDDIPLIDGYDFTWAPGSTSVRRIVNGGQTTFQPWTSNRQAIEVVYTHGWDTDSYNFAIAKMISLQIAGRAYVNPEAKYQEGYGASYSVAYMGRNTPITGSLSLTDYEK